MASLKTEVVSDTEEFRKLVKSFPALRVHFLSKIGARGRITLKGMLNGGSGSINLREFPKDVLERHTISSWVVKGANAVSVTSYVMNLFEKGRYLRGKKGEKGKREPGKRIITGRLKGVMMSRIGQYSREAEREILDPKFKKV